MPRINPESACPFRDVGTNWLVGLLMREEVLYAQEGTQFSASLYRPTIECPSSTEHFPVSELMVVKLRPEFVLDKLRRKRLDHRIAMEIIRPDGIVEIEHLGTTYALDETNTRRRNRLVFGTSGTSLYYVRTETLTPNGQWIDISRDELWYTSLLFEGVMYACGPQQAEHIQIYPTE